MFLKIASPLLMLSLLLMLLTSSVCTAGVIINGTRVIYPQNEKEVTVKLSNVSKSPLLVQSWIDTGNADEKPENIRVPFVLIPAINRIDPGKSQTLRISYTSSPALPDDKESVFWLNVLEVPPVDAERAPNRLQVAFRTRIKIFYRPSGLSAGVSANEAAEKLAWTFSGAKVKASNPTPYYISLASVGVVQNGKTYSVEGEMIAPGQSHEFSIKNISTVGSAPEITYEYINDWGAVKSINVKQ